MKVQRRLSKSEASLLAMRLRYENSVNHHKNAAAASQLRERIQAADAIRNYQTQYGILLESLQRMPSALQGPALQRMKDVGSALEVLRERYPINYPRGPDPSDVARQAERRRLN